MKKIISLILCLGLILTGCSNEQNLTLSVKEVVAQVYNGLEDLPELVEIEVTNENISYYLGIDNLDIKEGIASEPLRSCFAHSVVVVRVNNGVNVERVKKEIKENVNPRKWVCVGAEEVIVENKGDIIILIMANNKVASKLQTNFQKLK